MAVSKILYDGVGIDLTGDTVTAAHLESGYTAHDANGNVITGTLVPGGDEPTLVEKNITANGTYNASDDNADGYSKVTVNVSGSHTPSVSVNANGLVTASCGGQSTTHQLSSSDDADFVAANIVKNKTIFGVTGTHEGGSSYPTVTAAADYERASDINTWVQSLGLGSDVAYMRLKGKTTWGSRQAIMIGIFGTSCQIVYRAGGSTPCLSVLSSNTTTTTAHVYAGDVFELLPLNFS